MKSTLSMYNVTGVALLGLRLNDVVVNAPRLERLSEIDRNDPEDNCD